jgi:hypothetical protein
MRTLSIAFVLLTACGGGTRKPETPTTPTKVETAASLDLELGEMKLVDTNKSQALLIHADGSIEIDGKVPGKVTKDGKVVNEKGEVGFTLNKDGTITGPDGTALGITLSSDGVITNGDKKISLDATGALLGGNPDAPQMKVEGADTPGKKRTAMFVLIAVLTPTGHGAEPPGSGSN